MNRAGFSVVVRFYFLLVQEKVGKDWPISTGRQILNLVSLLHCCYCMQKLHKGVLWKSSSTKFLPRLWSSKSRVILFSKWNLCFQQPLLFRMLLSKICTSIICTVHVQLNKAFTSVPSCHFINLQNQCGCIKCYKKVSLIQRLFVSGYQDSLCGMLYEYIWWSAVQQHTHANLVASYMITSSLCPYENFRHICHKTSPL